MTDLTAAASSGRSVARMAKPNKADRELWSNEIDWLLNCAEHELGVRGTMASVISSIERGGAAGTADLHEAMLQRCGWARDARGQGHRNVERARRLLEQWKDVPPKHQRILVAHYRGATRVPAKVESRMAIFAAVAVLLWCEDCAAARARAKVTARAALAAAIADARKALRDAEAELGRVRRAAALARRSKYLVVALPRTGALVCPLPRVPGRERAFQLLARAHFLDVAARPLRSRLAELHSADATLDAEGSIEDDIHALVRLCGEGDRESLRARAEKAIRAAHRAWYEAGARQVERELEEAS